MPSHYGGKKKKGGKKLTNAERLKEHSKQHKGGLRSRHIQNMKKFMMSGDSFIVAHNKAVKLDKK